MDLFEGGIVKFDDIRYMAKRLYGILPTYCEPKQVVLDFSYSSPNVFSEITQLENPIFATSVMVSKKGKGSKVYVSASADNVENEKAFEVGNGDILSCGSLWRFIQVTGDKSGGDDVQLIVTGYELGYAFSPIPVEKEYIEGYAVQVDGQYPATINIYVNDTPPLVSVSVNRDGYWRLNGEFSNLTSCFLDRSIVSSLKIRQKQAISYYAFARRCESVESIDMSGVEATNLYFAFGLNTADYNNGYRSALQSIKLPIIRKTTVNTINCCYNTSVLTDVDATFIENSLTFQHSPLTLQSAINILSALQDLQGGTATISFSAYTRELVKADTTAMNLVAQAQSYGWTITGF